MAHSSIEIQGYAIVSDDDCIADSRGKTPASLHNEADWAYFQRELDRADLVALGRLGHEANPNFKRRPRLVLSGAAHELEKRSDAWWWNPAQMSWREAAQALLPDGGCVAVPGGQGVFDLFLRVGYDAFHLSRAHGVLLPGGRRLFAAGEGGTRAETVLHEAGLHAGATETLDAAAKVALTVWRKTSGR